MKVKYETVKMQKITYLMFTLFVLSSCVNPNSKQEEVKNEETHVKSQGLELMGNRFFTFNSVVRVNQIETSRDISNGKDEGSIHSPKEARELRINHGRAFEKASEVEHAGALVKSLRVL